MWVIDIRHWLNESQDRPAVPQLKKKVEKLREIIVFASSVESFVPVKSFPKCDKRPGRKADKIGLVGSFNVIIDRKIKSFLLDTLRMIKSDNKTRKFIMLILEKLTETGDKKLVDPLHEIADRFSVKMRSNVENAIEYLYEHEPMSN